MQLKKRTVVVLLLAFVLIFQIFIGGTGNMALAVSTVLDNCDSATGWTGSDTISVDTANKKEGTGSLSKTGSGTDWFKKVFSPAVNSGVTQTNGYLHLWLYVSDVSKFNGDGQIEVTSSGTYDSNEYSWRFNTLTLVNGWNELNLKLSSATKLGTPNLSAMNFIRVYRPLTASITCKIDDLRFTDTIGGATPSPTTSVSPTATKTPTPTTTPTPTAGGMNTLDNCDSISGWSGSDAVTLDTTNKREGTGCLSKTGTGIDWFKKTFSPAVNSGVTEAGGYLHIWLYVSDVTKFSGDGQIEITSSGGPDVNEYAWLCSSVSLVNGWNELSLRISSAIKMGTPDLSAINYLRIYRPLSASVTCKIDAIGFTGTAATTPTATKTPTPTTTPTLSPGQSPSAGTIRFVVMADSRGTDNGYLNGIDDGTNGAMIEAVLARIKLLNPQPQFAVVPGDLVGGSIGRNVNELIPQLQNWRTHVTKYYPITFFYPIPGNHEIVGTVACEQAFSNAFPEFTADNFLSGYYRSVYYFDVGNTRFFALNSNHYNESHKITGSQYNWLQANIDPTKAHNIFFAHEPAWGTWKTNNNLDVYPVDRDKFWDLLDSSPRPMYFTAHEHNYSRRHITSYFNANGYSFGKYVYQITTGGFGGPLNGTWMDNTLVDVLPIGKYHFTVVDINGNNITVTGIDKDGNILDSITQTTW